MPSESKLETELEFLVALEGGHVITQMALSKRIGVAVGLINALLQRAMRKGYVKAKAAPYKRYAYYLTPTGFSKKSRLVTEYLERSLTFFRAARQEYRDLFVRASASGVRRIAFMGIGELADIARIAAHEIEIEVVAVLDCETGAEQLNNLLVTQKREEPSSIDGVAITDSRAPQAVFNLLLKHLEESQILAPPFLRITRAPLDFKPKLVPK